MTLYRETPCEQCDVFHMGEKRNDPGAGCWATPGGSREEVAIDYEAAVNAYELWPQYNALVSLEQRIADVVDAALHTEKVPAS